MIFGSNSLSRSLDIVDNRLIGLYDDTSLGFLPGFGIRIISAIFSCLGQYCSLSIALNKYVSSTMPLRESSFSIRGLTWSMPGAFLVRRRLISVSICFGVNILMFGVVARSVSRYSETARSIVSSFGVNTSTRYSANKSAFS